MDYRTLEYELTGINTLLGDTETSFKVLPVKPSRGHIQARLRTPSNKLEINVDEDWDISGDSLLASYLNKSYHEPPLLEVSRDLLCHNMAHHQICPGSIEMHHRIMNTIGRALKEIEKSEKNGECRYICHAFEDIIANSWCKLNFGHFKGMIIFFYDQLSASQKSSFKNFIMNKILKTGPSKISTLYEIFVRLNLILWADKDDFSLLKRFLTSDREIEKTVDEILELFRLEDAVTLEEKVEILCNRSRWEKIANEFTFHIANFLEENHGERLSGENWFEKEIMEEDTQKRFIKNMYKKSKEKPEYIENIEVTRTIYELLASEIPIQVETDKKGRGMPVVPFNYDPYDPQLHSRQDIDLGGVVVDPESPFFKMINFRVPRYHYDLFVPYRSERRGAFPDICFLIDSSASMADDVESKISVQSIGMVKKLMKSRFYFGKGKQSWSDKSKYHHVLLGFNGALKWLQSHGIAPYIRYNVVTFSRKTLSSGWCDYTELDKCKRIAYLPQFDTTLIDHEVIEETLLRREPFVLIILSDGEIFNWDNTTKPYSPYRLKDLIRGIKPVKPLFQQIVENNMVSHIQISEGDFKPRISQLTCQDLSGWGAEIYRINDINRLETLMIRVTQKTMASYL